MITPSVSPKEILIDPMIAWNPQKTDPQSPRFHIYGSEQCMGNCFQNLYNWLGMTHTQLMDLARMDTYSDYVQFESWLIQNGYDKSKDFYSDLHTKRLNEILSSYPQIATRAVTIKSSILTIVRKHIQEFRRPVVLGTTLTKKGHIITATGIYEDGLIVSDPNGEYPYRNDYGYNVRYANSFLRDRLTRAVILV